MIENTNIKKMAGMLKSGATMLDKYCPKCENILFRLKNQKIFCPVCEKEIIIIDEKTNENAINKPDVNKDSNIMNETSSYYDINNGLAALVRKLMHKLENTDDLFIIDKILQELNLSLELIKKIRELQK